MKAPFGAVLSLSDVNKSLHLPNKERRRIRLGDWSATKTKRKKRFFVWESAHTYSLDFIEKIREKICFPV